MEYGKQHMGYSYLWADTLKDGSSDRINQKLGFLPLTENTNFEDFPVFTPEKNRALMKEYNVGSCQLCWIRTDQINE